MVSISLQIPDGTATTRPGDGDGESNPDWPFGSVASNSTVPLGLRGQVQFLDQQSLRDKDPVYYPNERLCPDKVCTARSPARYCFFPPFHACGASSADRAEGGCGGRW